MADLYIPVLAGTTREKRKSIYAARLVAEIGNSIEGITTEVVDPKDFDFPGDGNDPEAKDPRYTDITKRADSFFIVTPEYNHSFPGSLKRMLDSELKNYIHKPVALAGVSGGGWGGVRAIESLVPVVRELGLAVTFTDVQFPHVDDLFDESGKLVKQEQRERVRKAWDELIWMTSALKSAREKSNE